MDTPWTVCYPSTGHSHQITTHAHIDTHGQFLLESNPLQLTCHAWFKTRVRFVEIIHATLIHKAFLVVKLGQHACEFSYSSGSFHSQGIDSILQLDCSGCLRRRFASPLSRLHQFMHRGFPYSCTRPASLRATRTVQLRSIQCPENQTTWMHENIPQHESSQDFLSLLDLFTWKELTLPNIRIQNWFWKSVSHQQGLTVAFFYYMWRSD